MRYLGLKVISAGLIRMIKDNVTILQWPSFIVVIECREAVEALQLPLIHEWSMDILQMWCLCISIA